MKYVRLFFFVVICLACSQTISQALTTQSVWSNSTGVLSVTVRDGAAHEAFSVTIGTFSGDVEVNGSTTAITNGPVSPANVKQIDIQIEDTVLGNGQVNVSSVTSSEFSNPEFASINTYLSSTGSLTFHESLFNNCVFGSGSNTLISSYAMDVQCYITGISGGYLDDSGNPQLVNHLIDFTNISLIVGSAGTLSCALSETHWHIDSSYNGYIQSDPFSINLPPDTRIISFHDMHYLEPSGSQVYLHTDDAPFTWYPQSESSGYAISMDANNACINYSGYFEEGIPDPTYSNVLDISSVMFTFGNIDAPNAVSLSGPAFATPVQFTNISLIVGSAGTLSCALSETHWHIDSSYNGYIQSDPFSINLSPDTRLISFHDMHYLEPSGSQVYLHTDDAPFTWYPQS